MTDALVLCVRTPLFTGEDGVERERYASANAVSDHGATHGKKLPALLTSHSGAAGGWFRAVRLSRGRVTPIAIPVQREAGLSKAGEEKYLQGSSAVLNVVRAHVNRAVNG